MLFLLITCFLLGSLLRLTCYLASIHCEPISTVGCILRHRYLFLDCRTLDSKGSDSPDASSHDQFLLRAKVYFEVLNHCALFGVEHFSWRRLSVLLVFLSAFKSLLCLNISLVNCNLLFRSDLLRRGLRLKISHNENLWLFCLD